MRRPWKPNPTTPRRCGMADWRRLRRNALGWRDSDGADCCSWIRREPCATCSKSILMPWEASPSRLRTPPLQLAQTEPLEGPAIRLRIALGESLEAAGAVTNPGTALFIFARAPEGGPPVAVIRETASTIPGEFSLSDANNMLPGRSLADFDALTIVARISLTGQPTEQPGDLYGRNPVQRGRPSGPAGVGYRSGGRIAPPNLTRRHPGRGVNQPLPGVPLSGVPRPWACLGDGFRSLLLHRGRYRFRSAAISCGRSRRSVSTWVWRRPPRRSTNSLSPTPFRRNLRASWYSGDR